MNTAFAKPVPQTVLGIDDLAPGLYWIAQPSPDKGVVHHAVLDVGNRSGCRDVPQGMPFLFHQTPPSLRRDAFIGTGYWQVVEKIQDEQGAIQRLAAATANPNYHALVNNCEHFARYIARGKRESHQVQAVGVLGVLVIFLWAA